MNTIFLYLLEHFSSLEFSSEPRKQSETPSQSFLILKICSTSAVSFTWHPKKPSSRFTKKTSFDPLNCAVTCLVQLSTEAQRRALRSNSILTAWKRRKKLLKIQPSNNFFKPQDILSCHYSHCCVTILQLLTFKFTVDVFHYHNVSCYFTLQVFAAHLRKS